MAKIEACKRVNLLLKPSDVLEKPKNPLHLVDQNRYRLSGTVFLFACFYCYNYFGLNERIFSLKTRLSPQFVLH